MKITRNPTLKAWKEAHHPREAAGTEVGGQFKSATMTMPAEKMTEAAVGTVKLSPEEALWEKRRAIRRSMVERAKKQGRYYGPRGRPLDKGI